MAKERLDKVLVHMQIGSRREIKALVKQRRVTVDDRLALDPGMQVDPVAQVICFNGERVQYQRHFYYLLHKPGGVLTATEDRRQPTVMDLLPTGMQHPDLFPVGRLDKDTEGLLILTTDGELGHRLLSPRWHVTKLYLAHLDAPVAADDLTAFADGVELEDGYRCLPAVLNWADLEHPHHALITLQEGKYHQIKRMFAARGKQVLYLKRLAMGPIQLGELPLGAVRRLTDAEVVALQTATGLAGENRMW